MNEKNLVEDFFKQHKNLSTKSLGDSDLQTIFRGVRGGRLFESWIPLYDKIHSIIIDMLNEFHVFDTEIKKPASEIKTKDWMDVCEIVERKIKDLPPHSIANETQCGLIAIYMMYIVPRYLSRHHGLTYINEKMAFSNNNTLQAHRDGVFDEIQYRLYTEYNIYASKTQIIFREDFTRTLLEQFRKFPRILITAPYGMGKSSFLTTFQKNLGDDWVVLEYIFELNFHTPEYVLHEIRNRLENLIRHNPTRNQILLVMNDINLLLPGQRKNLVEVTIAGITEHCRQQGKNLFILGTSSYELEELTETDCADCSFYCIDFPEYTRDEIGLFLEGYYPKEEITPALVDDFYHRTWGYPTLIKHILLLQGSKDQDVEQSLFDNIFEVLGWDQSSIKLLQAFCAFRFIGPFFIEDFKHFVKDPDRLREIWNMEDQDISDSGQPSKIWMRLINKNGFIKHADQANHTLNSPFRISPSLRQMAEDRNREKSQYYFCQRHVMAGEYYARFLQSEKLDPKKRSFLLNEYLFQISKSGYPEDRLLEKWNLEIEHLKASIPPDELAEIKKDFQDRFLNDPEMYYLQEPARFLMDW